MYFSKYRKIFHLFNVRSLDQNKSFGHVYTEFKLK